MSKSLQDWTLEEAVTPAIKATDRGTGTSAFDPTRAIHCNVTDEYQLTFSSGSAVILMQLKAGTVYPFSVTNVLNASGNAIEAKDVNLLY